MKQPKKPSQPALDVSRRDIVEKVLGIAGAGVAATAFVGCRSERGDILGSSAQALASVERVDTVLGAVPPSARTGTLATSSPAELGGATVVVARGCVMPEDGGGGLFYWDDDPSVDASDDDGGTSIVPSAGEDTGRWIRVFDGPLNVRWFGAIATIGGNMAPAIMTAIASAAGQSYSADWPHAVYLPAGEYTVTESIVLPRRTYRGLTISGDGASSTIITGDDSLPELSPVMTFDSTTNHSRHFVLERLMINRQSPGAGFKHVPTVAWSPGPANRLRFATFRDLAFASPDPLGGPWTSQSPLFIEGGWGCTFENIECSGGESSFFLRMSARCTITTFSTGAGGGPCPDAAGVQASGIRIEGGGQLLFRNIRIEGCGSSSNAGAGFIIQDPVVPGISNAITQQVTVEGLSFEGDNTSPQIRISGRSCNILVTNIGIASVCNNNRTGIQILDTANNIRFVGFSIANVYGPSQTSNQSISIGASVEDVTFENLRQDGNPLDFDQVAISPGAKRIRLEMLQGNTGYGWSRYVKAEGWIGTFSVTPPAGPGVLLSGTANVRGYDTWRVPASTSIQNVVGGYDNMVLTLILGASAVVQTGGNLLLSGGSSFTAGGSGEAVIRLLYDQTNAVWQELSRSQNA